jgi:hypothetical protein
MDSVYDRIRRSIAQRGYWATLRLCVISVLWIVLPRFRRHEAVREQIDAEFDWKYGVDTGGVFRPKSNQVVGENWTFGGSYQAVAPSEFLQSLEALDLPFQDFTFVDFGAGKGRSLLLASLFPFKRIIGVEYCHELNQIARQNALRFQPAERRCRRIEAIDSDAAEYEIPNEPLVIFLFNPFAEQVMSRLVNNIADSYRAHARRIVVLYHTPNLAELWERTGLFCRTQQDPAMFDTAPAGSLNRVMAAGAIPTVPVLIIKAFTELALGLST